MPLDPQCAAIVAAATSAGTPFQAGDPLAVRRAYATTTAGYAYDPGPLRQVEDGSCAGPGGPIGLRLYRPHSAKPVLPALLYFHGGGWSAGDLDTHDHLCRHLAFAGDVVVIAVDYRLAPEHPFPAPLADCVAAWDWARASAAALGIDAERIAVGGDSAGGNLAAALTLQLRDAGAALPAFQLLIYPAVDFTADNASLRDNATGYLLTRAAMEMFADWYLVDRARRADPLASPLLAASHQGLPPALVQTAEFDPLRDEGAAYAARLSAAGVAVTAERFDGLIHAFYGMTSVFAQAAVAQQRTADLFRAAIGTGA